MKELKSNLKEYGAFLGISLYVGVCIVGAIIGVASIDEAVRNRVDDIM